MAKAVVSRECSPVCSAGKLAHQMEHSALRGTEAMATKAIVASGDGDNVEQV